MAEGLASVPELRAGFEQIQGVQRVIIDDADTIVLVCEPQSTQDAVAAAAAVVLAEFGLDPARVQLEITLRLEHRDRQRIRFLEVTRDLSPDHTFAFRVTLEWNERVAAAVASTERGEALELKAVASATLSALGQLVEEPLDLRVTGVKQVRCFDAELMVASLHHAGTQQLIGAVVVGGDPLRAACLAVLNALNRLLGNYLAR